MVLHSRGCGRVARRRIQRTDLLVEPHRGSRKVLFLFVFRFPGDPVGLRLREPPFFCVSSGFRGIPGRDAPGTLFLFPRTGVSFHSVEENGRRKDCRRDDSSIGWRFRDAGRPVGGRIPPPTGCFVPPGGPRAGGSLQSLGVPGRWGIPGIPGELPALIRWWNRLGNYALFRTQTLRRIEQNHVSRQSDGPAGRRPELA